MNPLLRKTIAILTVIVFPVLLFPQEAANNNPLPLTTDVTQQQRFQDPRAPRFLLTDRDKRFSLGIGGRVRAALEYDFGGIINSVDFYPSLISAPGTDNYSRNQFQMDATASSIFIKLVGNTNKLGDFTMYVNGYFRGNGNTLKLHNAYASFLGITIGFDYGSFTDAAASPATIDFEGPAGQVLYRTTQLRYATTFFRHWSFGIGIEVPHVAATSNDQLAVNTQRLPDIPAYLQYNWNTNNHFRIAGVVRSMTYSSNLNRKAYTETGWGVQATTIFNPVKPLKVVGQVTYGKGIANYLNDLSTQNIDLVPHPDKPGQMQTLPMLGWYAGLRYNISPKVFVSGTYSQSRIYEKNDYSENDSDAYQYGQYLAINAFWNIFPSMQGAVEYLYGQRNEYNGVNRSANRVSVLLQYSF